MCRAHDKPQQRGQHYYQPTLHLGELRHGAREGPAQAVRATRPPSFSLNYGAILPFKANEMHLRKFPKPALESSTWQTRERTTRWVRSRVRFLQLRLDQAHGDTAGGRAGDCYLSASSTTQPVWWKLPNFSTELSLFSFLDQEVRRLPSERNVLFPPLFAVRGVAH